MNNFVSNVFTEHITLNYNRRVGEFYISMYRTFRDRNGIDKAVLENQHALMPKGQKAIGAVPSEIIFRKDGAPEVVSFAPVSRESALKACSDWLRMHGVDATAAIEYSKKAIALQGKIRPLSAFFRNHRADAYIPVVEASTGESCRVLVSTLPSSPVLISSIAWDRSAERFRKPSLFIMKDEKEERGESDKYVCLLPPAFTESARGEKKVMDELKDFVEKTYGSCYERFLDSFVKEDKAKEPERIQPLIRLGEKTKERGGR